MSGATNKRLLAGVLTIAAVALVFTRVYQPGRQAVSEDGVVVSKPALPKPSHESSPASPAVKSRGIRNDSKLTPELAKSRLDEFLSKEPNLLKRTKFSIDLIQQLCLNGFSEEAFQLLDPNYGMVRSNQIGALFTFADLPNSELLRRMGEVCVFREDKEGAVRGYIDRLKVGELVEGVSDPEFQAALSKGPLLSPATLSHTLATALHFIYAASKDVNTASRPQLLKASKELIEKGYLKPFDFIQIATEGPPGNEFERWEEIQEVIPPGTLISGSTTSALNPGQSLVSRMVMSDGPRTLDNLLKAGDYQSADHAIMQWTHSDPSGATKWYESNAGKLTPDQNNAVSSAFASTALSSAEFDVARAWAGKVQDAKSKEDLLKKISEKEEKMLADRAAMEKRTQEQGNQ